MKRPQNRGAPIDLQRYRKWGSEFASFRRQVPEGRVRDWINKFDGKHHDIIARILDCVDFITHEQMAEAFRRVLSGLEGWNKNEKQRQGEWRFVAYSGSSGESGDQMLTKFRHANNMNGAPYNKLFIHRSDIVRAGLGGDDTVVLVDDFVGTGDQACDYWDTVYGELVAEVGRIYLVVPAGTANAIARINDETGLEAISHFDLKDTDNIFNTKCKTFSANEKQVILDYCKAVDDKHPKGHGDCGLLVVFSHTIPNNSIPILGKRKNGWEPLFSRYD